jgi:transmembrane sensor
MEQEIYLELVTRYLDGSATEEEARLLLDWMKANKENMDLFVQLRDIWSKTSLLTKVDTETEFALLRFKHKFASKDEETNTPAPLMGRFRNIAAILIIAVLSGALLLKFLNDFQKQSEIVYTETVIPAGQKGKVILSDGTKISLNSGTRIRYPSNFNQKTRDVYLQGEAYFEVAHNKNKPFFVHSGKMSVKVLGTSFNVKSYPDENKIETTLVTGSVEIFETSHNQNTKISTLKPNEQAVYDKTYGTVSIKKFEQEQIDQPVVQPKQIIPQSTSVLKMSPRVESVIEWKDQKLIFEDETLDEMAQKLTRWYGKMVHIGNEDLKNNRYSGKFIYNETIYQVLEVISLTTDIKYYEKDHEIYITYKE